MIQVAVDAILVLIGLEGVALTLFHHRSGLGPTPARLWPNLAAGFLLIASVRLALGPGAIDTGRAAALAALLGASLVAHGLDLRARWRR